MPKMPINGTKIDYIGEKCLAKQILRARTGKEAKQIANLVPQSKLGTWDKIKFDVMYDILVVKLLSCAKYRDSLIESGDKMIIEGTDDILWGCGLPAYIASTTDVHYLKTLDENHLGLLHETIRSHLIESMNTPSVNQSTSETPGEHIERTIHYINVDAFPLHTPSPDQRDGDIMDQETDHINDVTSESETEHINDVTLEHNNDVTVEHNDVTPDHINDVTDENINEVRAEPETHNINNITISETTGDVTNDHTDSHAETTDVVTCDLSIPGVDIRAESIYETKTVTKNKPHVSFQSIGNPTAKIAARQLKPKVTPRQRPTKTSVETANLMDYFKRKRVTTPDKEKETSTSQHDKSRLKSDNTNK